MKNNPYIEFVKENFPKSSKINDGKLIVTYKRIQEVNICIEILGKYSQLDRVGNGMFFLNAFQEKFNKLLLYLPLNDESGINIMMRTIIESLLKYFYFVKIDCNVEKINKISFRKMKDDLKKVGKSECFSYDGLTKLFSLYSYYSNRVHLKTKEVVSSCEYLQDVISSESYDISKINDDLTRIIDICNIFNINYFRIKEYNLTVSERLRLRNHLSCKRRARFLENLRCNNTEKTC